MFRGGKQTEPQCPSRLDIQVLTSSTWSRAPNHTVRVHRMKMSDIKGWSMLTEEAGNCVWSCILIQSSLLFKNSVFVNLDSSYMLHLHKSRHVILLKGSQAAAKHMSLCTHEVCGRSKGYSETQKFDYESIYFVKARLHTRRKPANCDGECYSRVAGMLHTRSFSLCSQPAVQCTPSTASSVCVDSQSGGRDSQSASYSQIRVCQSSTCFASCE